MAKLVYALNQSLDGYVDHMAFAPDAVLFRHFIDDVRSLSGILYGRRMYETMRYWDDDLPDWDRAQREYATAWRSKPKWVVSRSLKSVGPNARLVEGELGPAIRTLKAQLEGVVEVAGPQLATSLAALGLVDEFRMYVHPVVLGGGTPFFARQAPALRFNASEQVSAGVVRLTYVPAESIS